MPSRVFDTAVWLDALGNELIQRNGIAERTAGRMRRGCQKADVGGMAAIHVGMRDAADHREIAAVSVQ